MYDGPDFFDGPDRLPGQTDIFVPNKYNEGHRPRISKGFGKHRPPIGPPPDVVYDRPKVFAEPKRFGKIITEPYKNNNDLPTNQSPGYKTNLKYGQTSYPYHQEHHKPVASQKHIEYNSNPTYYGHAHNSSPSSGKQIVFVPHAHNDPTPSKHHPPVKGNAVSVLKVLQNC